MSEALQIRRQRGATGPDDAVEETAPGNYRDDARRCDVLPGFCMCHYAT
jgi:hypothetical protein